MDEKTSTPVAAKAPVYIVIPKGKGSGKKKKKDSGGAKRLRDIESRFTKSTHRVTKAVNKGVETYLDARDKSESKRKDGFAVDLVENVAKGLSDAVAEGSPIIHDVAEAFNTKRFRKQIRRATGGFGRIPLIGR